MGNIKYTIVFLLMLPFSFCYKDQASQVIPKRYDIPASEKILVGRSNQLGFDNFRSLLKNKRPDENLIVSPIGLSFTLNSFMTSLSSPYRENIKLYWGFSDLQDSSIISGFDNLYKVFTEMDGNSFFKDMGNYVFSRELAFSQDFLSLIRKKKNMSQIVDQNARFINTTPEMKGGLENIDFKLINNFEFKARGKYQSRLEKLPFYYSPDKSDFVEMIVSEAMYNYYADAAIKAVQIPLGRGNYNLLVILPRETYSIDALASIVNLNKFDKIKSKFKALHLEVFMPKLHISSIESFASHFKKGCLNAYFMANGKEFNGIVDGSSCYMSDFEQVINMDYVYSANPELDNSKKTEYNDLNEKESLFIDRPFLFIIYEKYSESIILMGKIVTP
jgi:serine protease inhibitor